MQKFKGEPTLSITEQVYLEQELKVEHASI